MLFIDASREFVKEGNRNFLTEEHQENIVNCYKERTDKEYLCKLVSVEDILANDANLSVSSYVEQEDTREVIDIEVVNAKLEKLIPEGEKLNKRIDEIVKELGGK